METNSSLHQRDIEPRTTTLYKHCIRVELFFVSVKRLVSFSRDPQRRRWAFLRWTFCERCVLFFRCSSTQPTRLSVYIDLFSSEFFSPMSFFSCELFSGELFSGIRRRMVSEQWLLRRARGERAAGRGSLLIRRIFAPRAFMRLGTSSDDMFS